jgi:hypothetical protein
MKNTRQICKSGVVGWRGKLRDQYASFSEFEYYALGYNLHGRLGYRTPTNAWRYNPTVEGSVNPLDFRRSPKAKKP